MGNICSNSDRQTIVAATLNFSGICLSPFEYHDCSVDKDFMSDRFKKLMDKNITQPNFSWDVGRIDLKLQAERYTPIYRKTAGVVNGKLINRQQFYKLWKEAFEKSSHILKDNQPKEEQIKQCMLFDWLCYENFLNIVYAINSKDYFNPEKAPELDPRPYEKFMNQWHSKTYLSNEKKMLRLLKFMDKDSVDVVFLQQAEVRGNLTWEKHVPKEFEMITRQGSEGTIILRRATFPEMPGDKQWNQKHKDNFNWNKDSVFIKRGNYLLFDVHLSSKATNVQQASEMFDDINKVLHENGGLQIILGADSNHFMRPSLCPSLNFIPDTEKASTTSKKRTYMQLQSSKANVIVFETKDHLLSTMKARHHFIGMINGDWVDQKLYLPCEAHPFDHFVVCAELIKSELSQP